MKLSHYTDKYSVNITKLAAKSKVCRQTLHKIMQGGRRVNLLTAARIVKATNALVDYEDLLTLEEVMELKKVK